MSVFSCAFLALCCVGLATALPRTRRALPLLSLPGGIPVDLLFATCEAESVEGDIGPCLADLLSGVIDSQRENFTTGITIGDDLVVLEPLAIDDVKPKKDKEFQVGATNVQLHGIQTIRFENFEITADRFAIEFYLPVLSVTGSMSLKYLFLSGNPDVDINLERVRVHLASDWSIDFADEEGRELFLVLHDVQAGLDIGDVNVSIDGLSSLGSFIEKLLNKNSNILLNYFIPDLEKNINKRLNRPSVNRIRIAN